MSERIFFGPTSGPNSTGQNEAPIKEKGTDEILPNLIDATSREQLQLVEDTMAAYRSWQVSANLEYLPGNLDAKHLRSLHAWLVQDVYPEVGNTRNDELTYDLHQRKSNPAYVVEVATSRKGANGEPIVLWPAAEVNSQLDKLSAQLRQENNLMGLEKGEFVGRFAAYYARYAHTAPFTSGNQHVLDVAFYQLGREAGYKVRLGQAPQLAQATDAVLSAGVTSDKSRLAAIIGAVVTEAEGPEAALRRKITMQVVRPKDAPN